MMTATESQAQTPTRTQTRESYVASVRAKCGHVVEVRASRPNHLAYKQNVVGMYECSECSAAKFENFGMAVAHGS
jgi:hypothetical protein